MSLSSLEKGSVKMKRFLVATLAAFICGSQPSASCAQAMKKTPAVESPSAAAEHGIELGTRGHCAEALPILKKSIPKIQDKDLLHDAAMARAQCGMATNDAEAVVESLLLLRREFPGDPKVLYVTTRYYSELANRTAQELMATAPSSAEAETLIAESFQAQGRWDDATAAFRKVLETNPNQPGIHYQLGRILLSKPMDPTVAEEAKKEFEAELKVNPTSPAAEFMLGDLAWRQQNANEAIEHFSKATQFDAGLAEAYLGLGVALNAAGKFADAIAPLKKYTELEPANPAGYYQLAIAYARTGNKPEADRLMALSREAEKKQQKSTPTAQDITQPH